MPTGLRLRFLQQYVPKPLELLEPNGASGGILAHRAVYSIEPCVREHVRRQRQAVDELPHGFRSLMHSRIARIEVFQQDHGLQHGGDLLYRSQRFGMLFLYVGAKSTEEFHHVFGRLLSRFNRRDGLRCELLRLPRIAECTGGDVG